MNNILVYAKQLSKAYAPPSLLSPFFSPPQCHAAPGSIHFCQVVALCAVPGSHCLSPQAAEKGYTMLAKRNTVSQQLQEAEPEHRSDPLWKEGFACLKASTVFPPIPL